MERTASTPAKRLPGLKDVSDTASISSDGGRRKTNISSGNMVLYPEASSAIEDGSSAPNLTRSASPLKYQSPAHVHRNLSNTLQRESSQPPKPRESLLPYKQQQQQQKLATTSSYNSSPLKKSPSISSTISSSSASSSTSKTSSVVSNKPPKVPAKSPTAKTPAKTAKTPVKSPKSVRATSTASPPPSGAATSARLVQNKAQLRTLEHVRFGDFVRLEFLYLRDNFIQSFFGMPTLNCLKILDISNNGIESLELLPSIPTLKELYLSSNMLTTVNHLPSFPQLEVLSLSFNLLHELVGLKDQPELRAFFIANNSIATLAGFPQLPKLAHLRIEGNPILYQATGKACALIVSGQCVQKLDGEVVTQEMRDQLLGYPIILASAIREGYIFGEMTFNVSAVCHQYLIERQKLKLEETVPSPPCKLRDIRVSGSTVEGEEVDVDFVFGCDEHIHRDDLNASLTSGFLTGTMNYQWHRGARGGLFSPIPNATRKRYKVTAADIGHGLKCECTPVLPDGTRGPIVYAICDDVVPTRPSAVALSISGSLMEGSLITVKAMYAGGIEGNSRFEWFRILGEEQGEKIEEGAGKEYTLTHDDVGHFISVVYTPVRSDGAEGYPATVTSSEPVGAVLPRASEIVLAGDAVEGETLEAQFRVTGGHDGQNSTKWFRGTQKEEGVTIWEEIPGAESQKYTLTLEDVGKQIKFQFLPVNERGIPGDVAEEVTKSVEPAPPAYERLGIVGKLEEGFPLALTGKYTGGIEGSSVVQWYRKSGEELLEIDSANRKDYTPKADDVGCYLIVHYTPMRSDGVAGKKSVISSAQTVKGKAVIGGELISRFAYSGGEEGGSKYYWIRKKEDGAEEEIEGTAGKRVYFATEADIGCTIGFRFTPVRADGVEGEPGSVFTDTVSKEPPSASPRPNIDATPTQASEAPSSTTVDLESKESQVQASEELNAENTSSGRVESSPRHTESPPSIQHSEISPQCEVAASSPYVEPSTRQATPSPRYTEPLHQAQVDSVDNEQHITLTNKQDQESSLTEQNHAQLDPTSKQHEQQITAQYNKLESSPRQLEAAAPMEEASRRPVDATVQPSPREEVYSQPVEPSPCQVEPSHGQVEPSPRPSPRQVEHVEPSPRQVESSPRPVEPSPRQVEPSPRQAEHVESPRQAESSPRPVEPSPRQVEPSPRQAEHVESSRQVESSPRPVEPSPRQVEPSPRQVEPSPRQAESSPRPVEPSPRQVEPSPRQAEHVESPRQVEASPRPVEPSPRQVASPHQVEPSPRQAERVESPRQVESSPRQVESSLRPVEPSPRQVEPSPRKVEQSPHSQALEETNRQVETSLMGETSPRAQPSPLCEAYSQPPSPRNIEPSPRKVEQSPRQTLEETTTQATPHQVEPSPRNVESSPRQAINAPAESPRSLVESPSFEIRGVIESPREVFAEPEVTAFAESPIYDAQESHRSSVVEESPRHGEGSPRHIAESPTHIVESPRHAYEPPRHVENPRDSVEQSPRHDGESPRSTVEQSPRHVVEHAVSPIPVAEALKHIDDHQRIVEEPPRHSVEQSQWHADESPRNAGDIHIEESEKEEDREEEDREEEDREEEDREAEEERKEEGEEGGDGGEEGETHQPIQVPKILNIPESNQPTSHSPQSLHSPHSPIDSHRSSSHPQTADNNRPESPFSLASPPSPSSRSHSPEGLLERLKAQEQEAAHNRDDSSDISFESIQIMASPSQHIFELS